MSHHVHWILELDVLAGKESAFEALRQEMVATIQANEAGTLRYEWSTTADGRRCHIVEHYADSDAVLTHLATFGQRFASRFLEALKPVRFVVYGTPSAAVQSALASLNPVYMRSVGGFSR